MKTSFTVVDDMIPRRNGTYRLATTAEIANAREDGRHVLFGCTDCGKAAWQAKGLALDADGSYTGARNIFYVGQDAECHCPARALRMITRS